MPDIDVDTALNFSMDASPSRAGIRARLKWFNGPKGFGFLNPEDRPDIDLFLHVTVLQKAGFQALGEGARLMCEVEQGEKGPHVKRIIEILDAGALPPSQDGGIRDPFCGVDDAGARIHEMNGTVKWYKDKEGFGFIVPEDGLKDVFVHKTCLDKHNIDGLEAGQTLRMRFRSVPKGREAIFIEILPRP